MREKNKNEGTYRGGEEGKTPSTTACPEKVAEGKIPPALSWEVKVIIKYIVKKELTPPPKKKLILKKRK